VEFSLELGNGLQRSCVVKQFILREASECNEEIVQWGSVN
jgi:hypothetical protein